MGQSLTQDFIGQLKKFAADNYTFANGRSLRKGTQEEAVQGFTAGLEKGYTHGHFEIPTGVGKTATFISLIDNYLKAARQSDPEKRVLVVVPSTDLVVQTAKAFAKFMPEVAKTIEADDENAQAIDWKNSQIGAQYSKLKHAHKKPKILITTYQSLVKDADNTTYPPKDYGFVVYDEGHFITGNQFSKSATKFGEAIQLAVTATTEYSEDKNVQQHLPYEYYKLPIATAIERGDLCGVQPILVQTDFTIDAQKFDSFIQQNNGRPLTGKQKEQLFNQKTRNQAILETYLQGKDKETGESYFGQSGLIFAAGIAHCMDLKKQLVEGLKSEKYKPLKEWLDMQGIALAAEIHSKTNGEELTIDGKKRFYTKDEIKNLHRDGKILLLLSDQELKQGTDFPADSIVMDTVDRYSWVDSKQRYGRGYRLDPENPDKTCKVFNFMDRNTRDIYGDSPEYLPIYCAETLQGVQFKKQPAHTAFLRFKVPPPQLEEALQQSGYELITSFDRVSAISATYAHIRKENARIILDLPDKPAHVWAPRELARALGIGSASSIFNSLQAQFKDPAVLEAEYRGIKIPREALVPFKYNQRAATGVVSSWGEKIVAAYQARLLRPDYVWSSSDLSEVLEMDAVGRKIIHRLQAQLADPSITHAEYLGLKIPRDALREYDYNGKKAMGITSAYGKQIIEAYKKQVIATGKPAAVWSGTDLSVQLKSETGRDILYDLSRQLQDPAKTHAEYRDLHIPRDAIISYKHNEINSTGIDEKWGKKIIAAYQQRAAKRDDVLSGSALSKLLGIKVMSGYNIVTRMRKQLEDPEATHADCMGVSVPRDAIVKYEQEGATGYGLQSGWAEKIAEASKKMQGKPAGAWSGGDLSKKLNNNMGPYFVNTLKKRLDANPDLPSIEIGGVMIPREALVDYYYNGRPAVGIKEAWGEALVAKSSSPKSDAHASADLQNTTTPAAIAAQKARRTKWAKSPEE